MTDLESARQVALDKAWELAEYLLSLGDKQLMPLEREFIAAQTAYAQAYQQALEAGRAIAQDELP